MQPLQVMQAPALIKDLYGDGMVLGHGRKPLLGMPTDGLGAILFRGVRIALPLDMREITPETGSLSDPLWVTPD